MYSYLALIDTMLSWTVFDIQQVSCWKSPILTYSTCIWCSHWDDFCLNFRNIFIIKKTVSGLSGNVVCTISHSYFSRTLTDRWTHDNNIYRANTASCSKISVNNISIKFNQNSKFKNKF